MGKPIILWNNYLNPNTAFTVEDGFEHILPDFPANNIGSTFTYPADRMMFEHDTSSDGIVRIRTGNIGTGVKAFGIVAFNFASTEVTLRGSFVEDGTYEDLGTITLDYKSCYMIRLSETSNHGYYEIEFDSSSIDFAKILQVAYVHIGDMLEFEKCIMKSYAPIDYNRVTEFLTNESGTGQFMGRSIVRRNHESSVSFELMSSTWVRSKFQPFVNIWSRTRPYFFAWNYDDYPNEVNFVWTDEDIGVSYTGDRNMMSASWKMRGFGNDQVFL